MSLQSRVNEFQRATFPKASAESVYRHLVREFDEFRYSRNAEEAADIVILLMGFADHMGFDLLEAVEDKLAILKTREWHAPDHEGVYSHIR